MPAGALVTVPLPEPVLLTVRVAPCKVNVAVTLVGEASVIVHGPAPLHHPPLQPVKAEPAAALAARVTALPLA